MDQEDAPLGHHLDQVTGAQFKRQVPPGAQEDDLMVEVSSLEEALCRARFDHPHRYRRGSTASSEFAPEPIEHRLFSLISQNWRGEPLVSHEVIVNLISATTTRTGLKVRAKLDPNACPAGVKVSEKQAARIQLSPDAFHGEWNSTIHPNGPKT